MSIKSDKWISRMAEQHKMIGPESQQVRYVKSTGNFRWGFSYGYDVRCANEFKIFAISLKTVDPKNFDSDAFVDVKDDCCIITNSFALARTVEYFRIPRQVLTVCLGKSTIRALCQCHPLA